MYNGIKQQKNIRYFKMVHLYSTTEYVGLFLVFGKYRKERYNDYIAFQISISLNGVIKYHYTVLVKSEETPGLLKQWETKRAGFPDF